MIPTRTTIMRQRTMFKAELKVALYPMQSDGLEVKMPDGFDEMIEKENGNVNDDLYDGLIWDEKHQWITDPNNEFLDNIPSDFSDEHGDDDDQDSNDRKKN